MVSAYIYLEGDLTDPATIEAMEAAINRLDQTDAQFARDLDGELVVSLNAGVSRQDHDDRAGCGLRTSKRPQA